MTSLSAPVGGEPPVRVLLVDGSLTFLDVISRSLSRRENVKVVGRVLTGLEAVDHALVLQPDLVLMDVGSGPVSGVDAAREIKRGPRTPMVALMSAADATDLRTAARAAGADAWLPKNRLEDALPGLLLAARNGSRADAGTSR